jgi:hypothetical protein
MVAEVVSADADPDHARGLARSQALFARTFSQLIDNCGG